MSVSILTPTSGTVPRTIIALTVAVAGPVVSVEYRLEGTTIGVTNQAPFSLMWNAGSVGNAGWRRLDAVARDAAGNTAVSAAVQIRVR
jgi:hypothetical protein